MSLNTFYTRFEAAANDAAANDANAKANAIANAKTNANGCRQENANTRNTFIISEHDVRRAFRRVNTRKAAGPDVISESIIVPVPKKTHPASLNDYCPVALTSVVMKCLERLAVKIGRHVSASLTFSTGAPQGCVLSSLLYSLYTYGCVATINSITIIKFADDTFVVGLISDNNEVAYLEEIRNLENWCQRNNLLLNVRKTKELIVDFSTRQERNYRTSVINKSPVERVDFFRYLSVHITQDLSWSCHINTVVKKARQSLYHLRCLRDFRLPSKVLRHFYSCTIESILTGNIATWFGNSTMQDR
ncbi:hypothetical protein QTP70_003912 [Hemibagrus guttatus]|uniref:Reverse transcriptase domain-containing protein n=1 Tax=Hemibagrus guttatus TaxID=175788 RepID=A0AAE0UVR4_9TELE|nr:hypothetical protein QTP70_003912 [Hemibagrus guttatus]